MADKKSRLLERATATVRQPRPDRLLETGDKKKGYRVVAISLYTPGSPIFKAVQKKRCKALCRALKKSPKSPESAVGAGSEPSYVDRSVGAP